MEEQLKTAAEALGTYKVKPREPEIHTPAEVRRLLNAAAPDFEAMAEPTVKPPRRLQHVQERRQNLQAEIGYLYLPQAMRF